MKQDKVRKNHACCEYYLNNTFMNDYVSECLIKYGNYKAVRMECSRCDLKKVCKTEK